MFFKLKGWNSSKTLEYLLKQVSRLYATIICNRPVKCHNVEAESVDTATNTHNEFSLCI